MIPNLKNKLQSLPRAEIKKEKTPVRDFDCSIYVKHFDIAEDESLKLFDSSDISHLKTACKIKGGTQIRPDEIVFFDTETTGLAGGTGTVAFLVGVGRVEGDRFTVRQFLMNDYHQEPSVLNEFAKSLEGAKAIATYNGKSFDAPLIKTRSIINRISIELDRYIHFDLLHACRRLYKLRLERMKLTDVERHVLGMIREDDVPGSEIPELFFRYLKYGDRGLLDKVIEHNVQDITSLAMISGQLASSYCAPERMEHGQDKYCAARTLIALSEFEAAERILGAIKEEMAEAKAELAYLKKTVGEFESAAVIFSELASMSRFDALYDIEASKIFEHRLKNYEQALNFALSAKEKAFNNGLLGRGADIMDNVGLRIARIKNKIEREKRCL